MNKIIQKQPRLIYVDVAKAIGLFMVILSHTVYPQIMYIGIGCFVSIFFIVSGYTTQSLNITKKTTRLIGSYIIFSIILFFLYLLIQAIRHVPLDGCTNMAIGILYSRYSLYPLNTTENIYFLNMEYNAPLWFLTSMYTGFLALIPLLKLKKNKFFLICIYIFFAWLMNQCPILLPWSIDCAPMVAIFLFIGIKLHESNFLNNTSYIHWLAIISIYCLITYMNGGTNLSVRDYGNSILFCLLSGISGSLLILKTSKWIERFKISKYLALIGQHSLVIFCMQMPLITCTRVIINKINTLPSFDFPTIAIALCQLLVAIVGGLILSVIMRKIHLHNAL